MTTEQFVSMLESFEYTATEIENLTDSYERMMKSAAVRADIEELICAYKDKGELNVSALKELAVRAADAVGIHEYSARLVCFLVLVPYSRPYFDAEGLSYDEWYNSMIDLKWKLRECIAVYGIYGTFVDWFRDFYFARRVTFGRLQFNLTKVPQDFDMGSISVKKDDLALTVHIPTDTRTPFNAENRLASYKRAEKYFAKFFDGKPVLFACATWLFNPAHEQILPESSNIRSFMSEFTMDDATQKEGIDNVWRIFNVRPYDGNPDALPETTSMMRAYKKHLKEGGTIYSKWGYMYLSELDK